MSKTKHRQKTVFLNLCLTSGRSPDNEVYLAEMALADSPNKKVVIGVYTTASEAIDKVKAFCLAMGKPGSRSKKTRLAKVFLNGKSYTEDL
jgi:hypothetical protein